MEYGDRSLVDKYLTIQSNKREAMGCRIENTAYNYGRKVKRSLKRTRTGRALLYKHFIFSSRNCVLGYNLPEPRLMVTRCAKEASE